MALRTAFYADYLAWRSLPGTDGILPDSNDHGA